MTSISSFKTRATKAIIAAALAAVAAIPAHAQPTDARWQPWLGCWSPDGTAAVDVGSASYPLVCINPVAGSPTVAIATIANRQVMHLEHINSNGAKIPKTVDGCPGWESATWSTDGHRLMMRSEFTCGNKAVVKGSAIFAFSAERDFLQIQGSTVGTNSGARVVRYHPSNVRLASDVVLADSAIVRVVSAPEDGFAIRSMRTFAGGTIASTDALLDVATHVDPAVAQAWLAETAQHLKLNAKQLTQLADGGLPGPMIDLLVAMSYPERFALQANDRRPTDREATVASSRNRDRDWDCGYGDRMLMYGYYGGSCYPGFYGSSAYGGLGYYNRYGYISSPFDYNNYYYGQQPIIIVTRGSDGQPVGPERGRAVKGQGYTRASGSGSSGSNGSTSAPRTSSGSSTSTSSGSSSGSGSTSSPPPASTSSGTSGGDRTAKTRPPGGLN